LSNEAIGERLGISPQTVKFHVSEILTKLGVTTRQEAARWSGRPRQRGFWLPWPGRFALGAALAMLLLMFAVFIVRWPVGGRDEGNEAGGTTNTLVASGVGIDGEPQPSALETPLSVNIVVCAENDIWQKPSVEQQIAQMGIVDPHSVIYGGFSDMHQSQFAASFWFPPTGPDFAALVVEFSGLWTEPNMTQIWTKGCPLPPRADWMDARYAWLLGYSATLSSYDGDRLIVRVEPKPGFEVVMLRFPDAVLYEGPVDFVDASGRVIARSGVNISFPGAPCDACRVVWSVAP
jgi:hypothetical protein